METLIDRAYRDNSTRQAERKTALRQKSLVDVQWHQPEDVQWHQPETAFTAMIRGIRGYCPRCNRSSLFPKYLKPMEHCPACQQDWTPQRADDFPAYVAIILTGHIMAPVIIGLVKNFSPPLWGMMAIIMSLAVMLMVALLQPAKGAIIAFQWWMEMHGFRRTIPIGTEQGSEDDC